GKHLAGLWEFPGGKRQPGESLAAALRRELAEELGVNVHVGDRLAVVPWAYPEQRVVLHFFRCRIGDQPVRPQEGQAFRWATPGEWARLDSPPADASLIEQLTRTTPEEKP